MQRFRFAGQRSFAFIKPLPELCQLRFAAIEVFAALHELGLSRLPRPRDFLLSDLQFALHVAEPSPLSGSLPLPIGFLLIEFDGVRSQLLCVLLAQLAEVCLPLLALVLQFRE